MCLAVELEHRVAAEHERVIGVVEPRDGLGLGPREQQGGVVRVDLPVGGDDGRLVDVVRRMEVVRLGQGIDRTGVIAPEAMERTLAMSREYAEVCRRTGVERVRFVATSASRDARNAGEFVEGVRAAFGDLDVAPEVVGIIGAAMLLLGPLVWGFIRQTRGLPAFDNNAAAWRLPGNDDGT